MQFSAEHYFRAAYERILDARELHKRGRYGFCIYASGLAVESLLRAFRWKKDPVFDARHDLVRLFRDSGILQLNEEKLRSRGLAEEAVRRTITEFLAAKDDVTRFWSNDFRFGSDAQIRGYLVTIGAYRGKRGDLLKVSASTILSAAQKIVDTGVILWTFKKK